jgi:hypothetical protein
MSKKYDKKNKHHKKKKAAQPRRKPFSIVPGIIILMYLIIPTYTPNWMAFDTNAPKFMTMAFVNILALLLLLYSKPVKANPGSMAILFQTKLGLVYTGFLVVSLLSFFNAVNHIESVVHFTKIFTVFAAVVMLSVAFIQEPRYFRWVIVLISGMLIFDSISVFYFINCLPANCRLAVRIWRPSCTRQPIRHRSL